MKKTSDKADSSNIDDRSFCLLRCILHTGGTHQIRVHVVYSGTSASGLERQALHAQQLAFAHPMTREATAFVAPLLANLVQACEALGLDDFGGAGNNL